MQRLSRNAPVFLGEECGECWLPKVARDAALAERTDAAVTPHERAADPTPSALQLIAILIQIELSNHTTVAPGRLRC